MHTIILNTGDIVFLSVVTVSVLAIAYFVGKARGIQAERRLMAGNLISLRKMMP